MNRYDKFELVLIAFLVGFLVGGFLSMGIWKNKCDSYETQIKIHNATQ